VLATNVWANSTTRNLPNNTGQAAYDVQLTATSGNFNGWPSGQGGGQQFQQGIVGPPAPTSNTINAPNDGPGLANGATLTVNIGYTPSYLTPFGFTYQWSDKNGNLIGDPISIGGTQGKTFLQTGYNDGSGVLDVGLVNYSAYAVTVANYEFGIVTPGYAAAGLAGDPGGLGNGGQLLLQETDLTVPANGNVDFQVAVRDIHADFGDYISNDGSAANSYELDEFTVPEPSTFALLGTAVVGLLAYTGRRRMSEV
jgi:hypothetical protein